jgi:hypothetical protein
MSVKSDASNEAAATKWSKTGQQHTSGQAWTYSTVQIYAQSFRFDYTSAGDASGPSTGPGTINQFPTADAAIYLVTVTCDALSPSPPPALPPP